MSHLFLAIGQSRRAAFSTRRLSACKQRFFTAMKRSTHTTHTHTCGAVYRRCFQGERSACRLDAPRCMHSGKRQPSLASVPRSSCVLSPHLPARFRYPGRRSERSRRVARATGHVSRGRLIGMRRKARENLISRDLLTRRTGGCLRGLSPFESSCSSRRFLFSIPESPGYGDRRRANLRPRS